MIVMIADGEKWIFLTVKNLSGLLDWIMSNHNDDSYCMNCLHSFRTENNLDHMRICARIIITEHENAGGTR